MANPQASNDRLMEIALKLSAIGTLFGPAEQQVATAGVLDLLDRRLDRSCSVGTVTYTQPACVFSRSGDSAGDYQATRIGEVLVVTGEAHEQATRLELLPLNRVAD